MSDGRPTCIKCNKPVDFFTVDKLAWNSMYIYTSHCHGEKDVVRSYNWENVKYAFNLTDINAK